MSLVLHVGAYNHHEGGIDRDESGGVRLGRLDRQLDLLAPLGLDVLISTEGKDWFERGDSAALELARARLGMVPVWVLAPRHGFHLVIWINPARLHDPQERHETAHPFWHAQPRVSVRVEGLAERLWFFGAHFSPFVPHIRVQEAYATANLADGRLVIGGGDFNDDALFDPAPNRDHLPGYKVMRHMRPGGESAAGVLAAAAFIDVAWALNKQGPREPTAGFNHRAPVRSDRLYVCERLRESPREYARLPYDPELSDHCAIHAWFDLAAAL